ncbi:MAG: tetraacyldisaccharide 4'-kinase [Castellaniella sp.]|nr:MAG: tetraacyldisaccharide 4'-kinase [Castellaniella sp.]
MLSIWSRCGALSTALLPLSWLYGMIAERRMRAQARTAWRAPVPVIVIGNILVGGTGKTPVAAAICKTLQDGGWHPGLVSRGYGIHIGATPHLSDEDPSARYLGDEPALLHQATHAPVAVHPKRTLAAQALLAAHPETDVLIADDGLQHRALARDVEVIVQDARGTGNGRLLPAGPLREPPERLDQADWLITNLSADATSSERAGCTRNTITMRLQPHSLTQLSTGICTSWSAWLAQPVNRVCGAAAGIGQPERFFTMLRAAGLELSRTLRLPDHGHLTSGQILGWPDTPILITPKDAVKCSPPHDPRLWVVQAEPVFDDPSWLDALQASLRGGGRRATHKPGNRH